jgi:peptidoglycan/xylan/chitin deacetylase (PgdA/CDA1 family)
VSREPDHRTRFDRRQLLLGGATLLAGVAVAACTDSSASNATSPLTQPSPTTSAQAPATTLATALTQPVATTTQPLPATTFTTAETTSAVASSATPLAPSGPATYIAAGPSDVNTVALTFHLGGDPALVVELLDLMKARAVTCTFFAIGDWLSANPELGHRAVDDGHELGNHTKSHKSMLKLSRTDVRAEIIGGGEALVPFIGSIGKWFRPSGTDVPTELILEEAGLAGYAVSVGYDIDSRDYQEPGAAAVVARVKKQLHTGAIVSLHFGHRDTIDALPQILDMLTANRLTNTTVTGLLG